MGEDEEVEVPMETESGGKENRSSDLRRSSSKDSRDRDRDRDKRRSSRSGDRDRDRDRDKDRGHDVDRERRSSRRSSKLESSGSRRHLSSRTGSHRRLSSSRHETEEERNERKRREKDMRSSETSDSRGSRSGSRRHLGSSRHETTTDSMNAKEEGSSAQRSETSDRRGSRSGRRRSSHDGDRHSSSDRRRSESGKDRDRDRRKSHSDRDKDRNRHGESREERDERKRKEKEDDKRQKEREEKREKAREERRKKDEELKKKREELRQKRDQSRRTSLPEENPATMQVNRADLRQINQDKFSNVYKMGRQIYKGEDTRVHVCHHWATGTERCVKITPKKSSTCHEFDMLKNMDHPQILSMYDLFVEETDYGFEWHLVVDLCKGKSLYYYLQKRSCKPGKHDVDQIAAEAAEAAAADDMFGLGAMMAATEDLVNAVVGEEKEEEIKIEEGDVYGIAESEAKEVMLQVLSCVNYLHKNKLVHADIKPQNLIMATGIDLMTLKMLDFDNSAHLRKEDDKINVKKGTPEYMAPEVHAGNKYDYKCDIWSCGVMCYELLSNTLPFGDSREVDEDEIALRVEEGKYTMAGPAWGSVSDDAKDFVKSLLVLRDKKRPTAEKAITHKWLSSGRKDLGAESAAPALKLVKNDGAKAAMANFRSFKADTKLKKATCAFIASQLLTKEEKDKIDDVFRAMDVTRDGKLSKMEVKAGFFQVFGTFLSDQELDDMFSRVDCDGTGVIEYSEFVTASLGETDLLSKDRLKKAFQLFDKDNSGSITISELREIFSFFQTAGADMDEAYIDKVIAQVDNDGDGDVSFDEFCEMMTTGVPI